MEFRSSDLLNYDFACHSRSVELTVKVVGAGCSKRPGCSATGVLWNVGHRGGRIIKHDIMNHAGIVSEIDARTGINGESRPAAARCEGRTEHAHATGWAAVAAPTSATATPATDASR